MSTYTEEDIQRLAKLGKPTPHAVFAGIQRFRKDKVHFVYHVMPRRMADGEKFPAVRRINLKFETVLRRAMLAERRAA